MKVPIGIMEPIPNGACSDRLACLTLVEWQRVLGKLYTEAEVRRCFLNSPRSVAEVLGLDQEVAEALRTSVGAELRQFGESLRRKRLKEARAWLPGLRDHPDFEALFSAHAEQPIPAGYHKPREDARAFARALCGLDRVATRRAPPSIEVRVLARRAQTLINLGSPSSERWPMDLWWCQGPAGTALYNALAGAGGVAEACDLDTVRNRASWRTAALYVAMRKNGVIHELAMYLGAGRWIRAAHRFN